MSSQADHGAPASSELPLGNTRLSDFLGDVIHGLLTSWDAGDVYVRLSAVGLATFFVLCVFICLTWQWYGNEISSVFDSRGETTEILTPIAHDNCGWLAHAQGRRMHLVYSAKVHLAKGQGVPCRQNF